MPGCVLIGRAALTAGGQSPASKDRPRGGWLPRGSREDSQAAVHLETGRGWAAGAEGVFPGKLRSAGPDRAEE